MHQISSHTEGGACSRCGMIIAFELCGDLLIMENILFQDQYVLCHTVVADFLNDFDAYANFKDLI